MKSKVIVIFLFVFISLSAQEKAVNVSLNDSNSFSMVILPDPQSYVKFDTNQPIFELMTAWIANNIENLNIKTVLCTGDLVEQNELLIPHGVNGNQTSKEQWEASSRAFERLDNKVPYVVCTGNHDYGYRSAENRLCNLSKYFFPERNNCWKNTLVDVGINSFGIPTLENAAYEFYDDNWGKLLVISMEFSPRTEILEWTNNILSSPRYKDHKVIILTHSYMNDKGDIYKKENYKVSPANYGIDIWEKVLFPSENIILLVCGHHCKIAPFAENVGFRADANKSGKKIHQMMFNAQTADNKWNGNGGDGWLRILEFLPDGKTIKVKTFSPLFAVSSTTADKAWRTGSYDQFDIVVE